MKPIKSAAIELRDLQFVTTKLQVIKILKKIHLCDPRDHLDRCAHRDTKQSVHSDRDFFGVSRNLDISELFMKILELVLFKPDSHRRC